VAAPFFPLHVQSVLIFSTTYPEIVFEKHLISAEFGPERLGLLLSQGFLSLSICQGCLTPVGSQNFRDHWLGWMDG
jgi:hypothetical protein